MIEITVPKLNNNDAAYDVVEWIAADGAAVAEDDDLVSLETSKAAEDLVSEHEGILLHVVQAGGQVSPGAVVGRLFADEAERKAYVAAGSDADSAESPAGDAGASGDPGFILTESARSLADEAGVTGAELRSLGKRVVKGSDIEELKARRGAAPQDDGARLELSPHQRAIGSVVTESHRTVPTSFTVVRMDTGAAEAAAARVSRRTGTTVGLPELVISELARLRPEFAAFFGSYHDDGYVALAGGSHVGVTVDLGNGLFIPVIRDADRMTVDEIAERMEDFRFSALRGGFRSSELVDAAVTLSLNNDRDVLLTQPIVFPGQTCMLSLGGVQSRLELAEDGSVTAVSHVHLGIAFDHRVVNGREAGLLLQAIKTALETADTESEPGTAAGAAAQGG